MANLTLAEAVGVLNENAYEGCRKWWIDISWGIMGSFVRGHGKRSLTQAQAIDAASELLSPPPVESSVWDRYSAGEIGQLFGFMGLLAESMDGLDDDETLEIGHPFGVTKPVRASVVRGAIDTIQRLWGEAKPVEPAPK